MPNTYTQLHVQVVFAVKYRHGLLMPAWRQKLFAYMAAAIDNAGHKSLLINGVSDHVHVVLGLRPAQALADVVKLVKQASTNWINDSGLTLGRFAWQEGYGAFSYGHSQLLELLDYVANQEAHHQKLSFGDEYRGLLKEFDIPFDERFVFHRPLELG